jgi:hypothetical protein
MAWALADDSGSGGDSEYFVLAGYVERESVWTNFSSDWQEILDLEPGLQYFKMSEAESLKGEFSGFTAEERDVRLGQFIDLILKHEPWEVSIAVSEKDYREVLYPVSLNSHASPYYPLFFAM